MADILSLPPEMFVVRGSLAVGDLTVNDISYWSAALTPLLSSNRKQLEKQYELPSSMQPGILNRGFHQAPKTPTPTFPPCLLADPRVPVSVCVF